MPLSSPMPPVSLGSRLVSPGARPAAANHKLTGEQQAIVDAMHGGHEKTVAEALAGTGKTSTLVAIANSFVNRPGLYLAFNKSVQIEAESRFPQWMTASTAHGLAYRALGQRYGHRLPGNASASRMGAQAMARIMKVRAAQLDGGTINPVALTRMAQATVNNYMKTADAEITEQHIPGRIFHNYAESTAMLRDIADSILPVARKIWEDLIRLDGKFRFTHDVYLKMWQLTHPRLPFDYIMFDEAQDADPVIASIIDEQNVQRIWVGDRNQAIYGWRGAIDAMSRIEGAVRLPLTQSFRFGPAIAEQANAWLSILGSRHKVSGFAKIQSVVGPLPEGERPRAVLTRGNGTALGWILRMHELNVPVAMAPGDKNAGKEFSKFAWAARDLMNGEGSDHPDLVGFQTWQDLCKFVEEEEDTADLKRMVGIINRVGVSGVIDAVKGLVTEDKAQITVSTAHKAKGMEWSSVRVADDFVAPDPEEDEPDTEALMLNYVTVTRAKLHLEPGALGDPGLWDR